ncbi:MAG: hypothetical protein ABWZ91_11610 [Nocardioides sp.]
MNHYEINTIASLLNDKLSKGPASSHYRHSGVVKPPRTRRRFAGKPRQD